jgi:N-acyl-L-homoserine lactone synthetase
MCSLFGLRKTWLLLFFFILINLPLYYVFQAPRSIWDFFQLSFTCPILLKIGTCSLNIMLTTISTHSPRGIHKILIIQGWIKNRLFGQAQKKKKNSNYQHYNILNAYEVKDETSTSSTYVSLVFYCMVRSKKILVKK